MRAEERLFLWACLCDSQTVPMPILVVTVVSQDMSRTRILALQIDRERKLDVIEQGQGTVKRFASSGIVVLMPTLSVSS